MAEGLVPDVYYVLFASQNYYLSEEEATRVLAELPGHDPSSIVRFEALGGAVGFFRAREIKGIARYTHAVVQHGEAFNNELLVIMGRRDLQTETIGLLKKIADEPNEDWKDDEP